MRYFTLSTALKEQFNRLLVAQDPELTEWLCYDAEPPEEVAGIVKDILETKRTLTPE